MSSVRRLAPALLVLAFTGLGDATAYAEPDDANVLVHQGVELRRAGRDADALQLFRRAYAASPSPRVRAQVGLAEWALADWVTAEGDISAAIEAQDDPWIARNAAVLDGALREVRSHLASVDVRANADGAELWIGGVLRGTLPLASGVRVAAGELTIAVRAEGFEPVEETVVIPPGGEFRQSVTLHSLPAPSATPERVEPAAPQTSTPPPADRGPTRPEAPRPASTPLGWALLGTSGAFVAGATAAWVVRNANASVYDDDARCLYGPLTRDQRCGEYRDRATSAGALAIAGYALGATAGILSAVAFVTPRSRARDATFFACGPAGMGVACGGRF
jgi:hypothetical protein